MAAWLTYQFNNIHFRAGYNVAVIALKATLQIASCVYIDVLQQKACAFVQIMSLVCSYPAGYGLAGVYCF